jgi:hypothetical protein
MLNRLLLGVHFEEEAAHRIAVAGLNFTPQVFLERAVSSVTGDSLTCTAIHQPKRGREVSLEQLLLLLVITVFFFLSPSLASSCASQSSSPCHLF